MVAVDSTTWSWRWFTQVDMAYSTILSLATLGEGYRNKEIIWILTLFTFALKILCTIAFYFGAAYNAHFSCTQGGAAIDRNPT